METLCTSRCDRRQNTSCLSTLSKILGVSEAHFVGKCLLLLKCCVLLLKCLLLGNAYLLRLGARLPFSVSLIIKSFSSRTFQNQFSASISCFVSDKVGRWRKVFHKTFPQPLTNFDFDAGANHLWRFDRILHCNRGFCGEKRQETPVLCKYVSNILQLPVSNVAEINRKVGDKLVIDTKQHTCCSG